MTVSPTSTPAVRHRAPSRNAAVPPAPHRPERLTPDDDLFVRMEHAAGLPVVNQCVWRLGGDVDEAFVAELADRLALGRLSRLVVRRRLPVPDRWVHSRDAGRYRFETTPIRAAELAAWARARCDDTIDTIDGPAWRLSAIRLGDTGETAVSLVASHVVGDGGAVLTAVREAVTGIPFDRTDVRPTLADEVHAGAALVAGAARSAYTLARQTRADGGSADTAPSPAAPPTRTTDGGGPCPTTITTVPVDGFDAAAAAAGGTPNTLFAAIVLGVLCATGRVGDGDEVPLALPVSTRLPGDRRANATSGCTARIIVSPNRYRDLGVLRAACKDAYRALDSDPGRLVLLGRVAQPLTDGLVRRLVAGSTAPLCLASNLGDLDDDFASLGGAVTGPVAMRSVTVAPAAVLRRMAGGIGAWASRSADRMTLCVTSLDPDRVADDADLTGLLHDELGRWGLSGTAWGS